MTTATPNQFARNNSMTGARNIVSGFVSNGATWYEDVAMSEDGSQIASADTFDWRMTFRDCEELDSLDLTLSTDDSTLAIVQAGSSTTLQIRVPYTSLSAMEGDFVCDLASKDPATGRVVHWAHGVVTFVNEPIWSS